MTKFNIANKINASIGSKHNFVMNQSLIRVNARRETRITKILKTAVNCLKQS